MTQQVGVAEGAGASPGEPPERVRSELLWRLAARLYRDHEHRPGSTQCLTCRQRWPCSGRRLAELGLIRAISVHGADEATLGRCRLDQGAPGVRDQSDEGRRHIREPEPAPAD